jgi:hypothetical protein
MLTQACEPWGPLDETCCEFPTEASDELKEQKLMVATQLLWAASGRRIGPCPVTIRPCLEPCEQTGSFGAFRDASGSWRNRWCGCGMACSCSSLCRVFLPGPVDEVTEVRIDGVALSEDLYRLVDEDGLMYLVRTDDTCWPSCQDYKVPCEEAGSFCVTYLQGLPISELAIAAVSELTCELVRACIPGCPCRLPDNVASQTRQGVTITFDRSQTWLRSLPTVAAFLDVTNPHGLTSAPSVWSPDLPSIVVERTAEGS